MSMEFLTGKMWAEAVVRVLGEKKGIDVSQMTGIDFAAFKETQYDILAAELRKHLDMKKIYENSGAGDLIRNCMVSHTR